LRCVNCKADFPFDLTIDHKFDCVFCGEGVFPTAEDFVTYPELGLAREVRPTQIGLTKLIDQTVFHGGIGIYEAGTGVGKSYAYLLASVLNNKRTVVSTAKKSLQSQLYEKDLPLLKSILLKQGRQMKFAIAYGKSNYVCRKELPKGQVSRGVWEAFAATNEPWTWDAVTEYSKTKAPKTHLSVLRYSSDYTAEQCSGIAKCEISKHCTFAQHRTALPEADIVVTNHWLLGYHLRLKREQGYELLGPIENIIVDEAHKIEDGIRTAFTDTMSENALGKAVKHFEDHVLENNRPYTEANAIRASWDALFKHAGNRANATDGTVSDFISMTKTVSADTNDLLVKLGSKAHINTCIPEANLTGYTDEHTKHWLMANGQPHAIPAPMVTLVEKWQQYSRLAKTLYEIQSVITNAADPDSPKVTYVEKDARSGAMQISISPIEVSTYLRALIDAPLELPARHSATLSGATHVKIPETTITYLSATLAVAGKFDVFATRAGLSPSDSRLNTAQFGSAFDLSKQATLYIANSLGVPTRGEGVEAYRAGVAEEIYELTEANKGNAFVLFTARDEMLDIARRLEFGVKRTSLPILVQDNVSAADLLKQYRNTPNAVLFGLKSFWEGIDVTGDKLSLVIIVKLPFPGRGDPVVNARRQKAGDLWFPHVDIPDMIFDLRQGIGRLIRTTTDTGVVAILDSRALTKNYSKTVLRSTGFVRAQTQRNAVVSILQKQAAAR
jgi:Rad3-related DNA helicase